MFADASSAQVALCSVIQKSDGKWCNYDQQAARESDSAVQIMMLSFLFSIGGGQMEKLNPAE